MLQFSWILGCFVGVIVLGYTEGKIFITIQNATGIPNPKYLDLSVSTRNTESGPVVDIDSHLKADMGTYMLLWVDLQAKNELSGYETLFKSDNLDVCVLLESAKDHPMVMPLMKTVDKHGNIPQTCPVVKGHYYLKDFRLDGDILPSYCPSGQFRVRYGMVYTTPANVSENIFEMQWDIDIKNDMDVQ